MQIAQFGRDEDVAIFPRRPAHLEQRLACADHRVRQSEPAEFGIPQAREEQRTDNDLVDAGNDVARVRPAPHAREMCAMSESTSSSERNIWRVICHGSRIMHNSYQCCCVFVTQHY